jgi:hypothetical protein
MGAVMAAEMEVGQLSEAEARQELARLAEVIAAANEAYHSWTRPRFRMRTMMH